jgi:hypothetical protein
MKKEKDGRIIEIFSVGQKEYIDEIWNIEVFLRKTPPWGGFDFARTR